MYICTCTFCGETHRDVYGVSSMEKVSGYDLIWEEYVGVM